MKRLALTVAVLVAVFGIGYQAAVAAPGDLLLTIPNPSPDTGDNFGICVSPMGNNILVGAHRDDHGVGAAYLMDSGTALPLLKFQNPYPHHGDEFGLDVKAMGTHVLIGAQYEDELMRNYHTGIAYLFDGTLPGPPGLPEETFRNPRCPACEDDHFGVRVTPMGNHVLIGAYSVDVPAPETGAVDLFDSDGNYLSTIENPEARLNAGFGISIATLGNQVVVGAFSDDVVGADAGAVYLIDVETRDYSPIRNPDARIGEWFGHSVAVVGENIAIGAPCPWQGAGAAYLFDGSTGELLFPLQNPNPSTSDRFGWSLAAVGGDVVVGAPTAAGGAGAAYLFDGSTGELLFPLENPNLFPGSNDQFGYSVAGIGINIAVGAPGAEGVGAAYLFQGIPEPSTVILLSMGAIGLLAYAWKKRPRQ